MTTRSVAFAISDGVRALDVAGPLEIFSEASSLLGDRHGYDVAVLAGRTAPIRASSGLAIAVDADFTQAASRFDTTFVVGGLDLPNSPPDPAIVGWLRSWGARSRRYGAIRTGVFSLGAAGLLEGRSATAAERDAARLSSMYPQLRIEPGLDYVRDGPLATVAGRAPSIELALALVADDHGAALAEECSRRIAVALSYDCDTPDRLKSLRTPRDGSSLARVQAYVRENLHEALSIDSLAQVANTSSRTLARLFTKELGVTPHQFVEDLRLGQARHLLDGSDAPLKVLAHRCGFGGAEQMRVVFKKRMGISPAAYRERRVLKAAA